jgi:cytochrome c oxidase assembly factor CtaG
VTGPRGAAFAAGLAVLTVLAAVHPRPEVGQMLTHAAISVLAAPLIVAGAPARTRAAVRRALAPRLAPALCWASFVATHWTVHLLPAFRDEGSPAHPAGHALTLLAALLFWAPVLADGPGGPRLRGAAASLHLFLAMPAVDLVTVPLVGRGEAAAAAAMLGGMLPLGVAALAVTLGWMRDEDRQARLAEAGP